MRHLTCTALAMAAVPLILAGCAGSDNTDPEPQPTPARRRLRPVQPRPPNKREFKKLLSSSTTVTVAAPPGRPSASYGARAPTRGPIADRSAR